MRVLLLGSGLLGLSLLESLVTLQKNSAKTQDDSLHNNDLNGQNSSASPMITVVGVFPWSNTKKGKGFKDEGETLLLKAIRKHRLKTLHCAGANHFEFTQYLQSVQPNVILVGCWGEILKPHLIDRPNVKIINCHPSKLPEHRGANPYSSVIIHNETETGVTFHWMSKGIDEGPIILQQSVSVTADETGGSIRDKCCASVKIMLPEVLRRVATTTQADYPPQPDAKQSYYPQITLADGMLDWTAPPSIVLNRLRGYNPWLIGYSMLQGQLLYIFHQMYSTERVTLDQSNIQRLSAPPEVIPPGTVLAMHHGKIWIQSAEASLVYVCVDYQLYMGWGFLPRWLSRFWSRMIIKPGHRFLQAFAQGVASQTQKNNTL